MRKFFLITAALGGLCALGSVGAQAAPFDSGLKVAPTHASATPVDYNWHHHQWHHRRWEHHHWHYYD